MSPASLYDADLLSSCSAFRPVLCHLFCRLCPHRPPVCILPHLSPVLSVSPVSITRLSLSSLCSSSTHSPAVYPSIVCLYPSAISPSPRLALCPPQDIALATRLSQWPGVPPGWGLSGARQDKAPQRLDGGSCRRSSRRALPRSASVILESFHVTTAPGRLRVSCDTCPERRGQSKPTSTHSPFLGPRGGPPRGNLGAPRAARDRGLCCPPPGRRLCLVAVDVLCPSANPVRAETHPRPETLPRVFLTPRPPLASPGEKVPDRSRPASDGNSSSRTVAVHGLQAPGV